MATKRTTSARSTKKTTTSKGTKRTPKKKGATGTYVSNVEPTTKKKGKTKSNRKPVGIIQTIVECLQKASADKPVTREQLLARLTKRFPSRNPVAMSRTVNCQLGRRMFDERGVRVKKNDKGYWTDSKPRVSK